MGLQGLFFESKLLNDINPNLGNFFRISQYGFKVNATIKSISIKSISGALNISEVL